MKCIFSLTVFLCVSTLTSGSKHSAKYELPEEWTAWKSTHGKNYLSEVEELERHLVWLSNKEYVDLHNQNSHIFGFTLDLNHLGDMVSASEGRHGECTRVKDYDAECKGLVRNGVCETSKPLFLPVRSACGGKVRSACGKSLLENLSLFFYPCMHYAIPFESNCDNVNFAD